MNEEEKTTTNQGQPQFIPELKGKKVIIRLVSGGQPVTGTIKVRGKLAVLAVN